MSALSAEGLSARYPGQAATAPALLDLSLALEAGERLLLLGPNGAGKSTFIRVFAGLMRPNRGKALIAGQPARLSRAQVGVVSHATFLYDELTTGENLRLYGELYGVPDPEARARYLLDRVGIPHLWDVQIGRLSRGQQQRVTIARALLHEPAVLLLDEPDTGLDVAAFELLERLVLDAQPTVVLTTHNPGTGLRLANRVAVLSRGRLVHVERAAVASDAIRLTAMLQDLAHD